MRKTISLLVIMLAAFMIMPLNLSAQSKAKRKSTTKTYQKKNSKTCSWESAAHDVLQYMEKLR